MAPAVAGSNPVIHPNSLILQRVTWLEALRASGRRAGDYEPGTVRPIPQIRLVLSRLESEDRCCVSTRLGQPRALPRKPSTNRSCTGCWLLLRTLTKAQLEAWVISRKDAGMSPAGINIYIRSLNSFFSWLKEEDHIKEPIVLKQSTTQTYVRGLGVEDFNEEHARMSPLVPSRSSA